MIVSPHFASGTGVIESVPSGAVHWKRAAMSSVYTSPSTLRRWDLVTHGSQGACQPGVT